ncbi:GAF and ANTAR domain-containing protein [Williamsia deligens]|uniref:GAF and ANTAR domain-containing protein n=1 Tax=Williamsia deligens TaxID=321325 RepID=A0ABW3G5C6_9NOCA|nr:GAF and ANTAR domain-containing protein [Williamsia deligens]MCP2193369.1 GAF domain-containing protein [Williamsia deligens]
MDIHTRMAEMARSLHAVPEADPDAFDQVLAAVTAGAVEHVAGADHAGILLVESRARTMTTVAPTDDVMVTLDTLQQETDQGPCLEAAWEHTEVWVDDIATDGRWPELSRRVVAETPARSSLSFQLFTHQGTMGALNLFSDRTDAFSHESREIGRVFATHAALAMFRTRQQGEFRSALASRDTIGQAKGMIMERFGVDPVEAFALLRKLSQDSNTPVTDVAQRLVESPRST